MAPDNFLVVSDDRALHVQAELEVHTNGSPKNFSLMIRTADNVCGLAGIVLTPAAATRLWRFLGDQLIKQAYDASGNI